MVRDKQAQPKSGIAQRECQIEPAVARDAEFPSRFECWVGVANIINEIHERRYAKLAYDIVNAVARLHDDEVGEIGQIPLGELRI